MAASLLTTGNSGGMLGGFVDSWAVSDFLKSRDCMRQLDRKIGLRQILNAGMDPVNHLSEDSSETTSTAPTAPRSRFPSMRWSRSTCCACAYSQDAETLSRALIGLAEEFVSSMNERAWPTS